MPTVLGLELAYSLYQLPPGRLPFRRWRWELWHGATLRASGWRTSPAHAQRALRTAASYWAHEAVGLRALRPDTAQAHGHFGSIVHVDCGDIACVLLPRAEQPAMEYAG